MLVCTLISMMLATFAALRGPEVAADFSVYQDWYINRDLGNGFFERPGFFEAIYFFLNDFFEACAIPFRFFIWFLAFTAVLVKTNIIFYFSKNSWAFGIALLSYSFTFYLLHDFTQIRVGLAIALLFLAFYSLVERAYIKFLIFSLLALGFHSSALVAFLLLLPYRRKVAVWVDGCMIMFAVGSMFLAAYGISIDAHLADALSAFDPRINQYIMVAKQINAEVTDPFAIRALLLMAITLTLFFVKMNGRYVFEMDDKDVYAVILVRRSILIGLSCLFLFSPIPELAVRLFEINIALLPILVAIIFSHRGWLLQKILLALWVGSIFYAFVVIDRGLVKPYVFFFT